MTRAYRLVEKHISHRDTRSTIRATTYANRVDVRHDIPPTTERSHTAQGGGKRSPVRGYSASSRRRHYRALAALRPLYATPRYDAVLFITVTFPDDVPHGPATAKACSGNLFKRIQRTFPWAGEHWRLHLEPRKSGPNLGQMVPHVHSLLFTLFPEAQLDAQRPLVERTLYRIFLSDPTFCEQAREYERLYEELFAAKCPLKWQTSLLDAFRIWLAWNWYEIVGSGDQRHLFVGTSVRRLRTRPEVMRRVHYLAQDDTDGQEINKGSQSQPGAEKPGASTRGSHDNATPQHTGRVWGERGQLDRSPALVIRLTWKQFVALRRLIVAYLRSLGGKGYAYARWIAGGDRRE